MFDHFCVPGCAQTPEACDLLDYELEGGGIAKFPMLRCRNVYVLPGTVSILHARTFFDCLLLLIFADLDAWNNSCESHSRMFARLRANSPSCPSDQVLPTSPGHFPSPLRLLRCLMQAKTILQPQSQFIQKCLRTLSCPLLREEGMCCAGSWVTMSGLTRMTMHTPILAPVSRSLPDYLFQVSPTCCARSGRPSRVS